MAGDSDEALLDFNRAIDIDAEYGAAFYSRASLLTKMGQEDSALEDMKMVMTSIMSTNTFRFILVQENLWVCDPIGEANLIGLFCLLL